MKVTVRVNKKHKQIATTLKKNIKIDMKILPIVKYINSFDTAYTIYSCEGDAPNAKHNLLKQNSKPYVKFISFSTVDVAEIESKFEGVGHIVM